VGTWNYRYNMRSNQEHPTSDNCVCEEGKDDMTDGRRRRTSLRCQKAAGDMEK